MSLSNAAVALLTDAAAVLPSQPHAAGAVVAAVTGAAVWGGWQLSRPPRDGAPTPTLIEPRQAPRMAETDTPLLHIPLDVIPTDDQGRNPYDLVGPDAIRAVVDQFYSKVTADPDLGPMFDGVDMAALKRHQALFIGQLWGGPVRYKLTALRAAHARLDISPDRYWKVVGHLMVTLTHVGVPDWVAVFTMTRLYQARELIITGGAERVDRRHAGLGMNCDVCGGGPCTIDDAAAVQP
jgi:hemoglobin